VTFTTFTLIASFILFRGFNTTDTVNTISLLCGFLTIFSGVYLLNLSREDPNGENLGIRSKSDQLGNYHEVDGIPADGLAGISTRMSMQARRSGDEGHRRSSSWSLRSPVTGRYNGTGALNDSERHLMHSYDVEAAANGLGDLAEDSDEDSGASNKKRTSFDNADARRKESDFPPPRRSRTSKSFDKARR